MIYFLLAVAGWFAARITVAEVVYYTSEPDTRAVHIIALLAFDLLLAGIASFFVPEMSSYILVFASIKAITVAFMDFNHILFLNVYDTES